MSERDWPAVIPALASLLGGMPTDGLKRVRLHGEEYLLIGGAIATEEAYSNGECSYAHLFDDGRIMRFGEQIGTQADLEFLDTETAP